MPNIDLTLEKHSILKKFQGCTSSKELIDFLKKQGWKLKNCVGSHHHYIHDLLPGKVTIPHPKKQLHPKTVKNILKQAKLLG